MKPSYTSSVQLSTLSVANLQPKHIIQLLLKPFHGLGSSEDYFALQPYKLLVLH
uniref:Uncharacterized protein n=1 Tax=Rhizophora mucronata TaxID=61149 RepID=A0A2P2P973_RHIMU